jgi:uncharacterized protein YecT (DUF1311 family)
MEVAAHEAPYALDPLIAEAKRRTRRRRALLALVVAAGVAVTVVLALAFRPPPVSSGSANGPNGGNLAGTGTPAGTAPSIPLLPTKPDPHSVARFACPKHPGTAVAIESCLDRRLLALNAKLDDAMRALWPGAATGQQLFAKGERAWLAYTQNECASLSGDWSTASSPHGFVGGTSAPGRWAECYVARAGDHLRELRRLIAELGRH